MQKFRALPSNPQPPAAGCFAPRPPKQPPSLRISGYAPAAAPGTGPEPPGGCYATASDMNPRGDDLLAYCAIAELNFCNVGN